MIAPPHIPRPPRRGIEGISGEPEDGVAWATGVDALREPVATTAPALRVVESTAAVVPSERRTVTRTGCSFPFATCQMVACDPGVPTDDR